jgi:translation initiation factor 2 gamma subunit (eIF-2gamma)
MRGCGWLKQNIIMKTVGTIGHVDHGKTTLTSAIKSVLEKEKHSIYKEAIEEVFEYKNPYAFLNEKKPASKSRLKKCKKGLHEYMSEGKIQIDQHFYKEKWYCIHCGALMQGM